MVLLHLEDLLTALRGEDWQGGLKRTGRYVEADSGRDLLRRDGRGGQHERRERRGTKTGTHKNPPNGYPHSCGSGKRRTGVTKPLRSRLFFLGLVVNDDLPG